MTDLTSEGALFLRIAEKEAKELEALRKMEEMSRKKENERNGEKEKPTPNANVATEETFEEGLKEAFEKAPVRKDAELDASAKRLSEYDRR